MSSLSSSLSLNRYRMVPISSCVRSAIQRSLCANHYAGFQSFHEGFLEFKEKMDMDWEGRHAHLMAYFPPPHKKVGKKNWQNFQSWLNYGLGEKVKDVCNPWVEYGLSKIRSCEACKAASTYVPPPPNDEVIDISEDEDGDENGCVDNTEDNTESDDERSFSQAASFRTEESKYSLQLCDDCKF